MKLFLFCVYFFIVVINLVNGGYTVIQNANGIFCDGYKCPENSANCVISQKTRPDLTKIDYVRKCLDGHGNVLDQYENTVNNPHPGTSVNNYISSGGYSNIITSRNGFGGDDEQNNEIARKNVEAAQKHVDEVLRGVKHQQEYWQQWSTNFNRNLQNELARNLRF